MRNLLILFLLLAASTAVYSQSKNLCADVQPYEYKTKLKGGYRIVFKPGIELEYLYLYKGNLLIKKLSDASCAAFPHKSLGYVTTDFDDYFVFVHSFGSGNPHEVELIRKRDGKNILDIYHEACLVDSNEKYSILLFSNKCVPSQNDKIILMDVRTQQKRYLNIPALMFSDTDVLNRIEIASISKNILTLKFDSALKRYKL